jgi:hypothetical protein
VDNVTSRVPKRRIALNRNRPSPRSKILPSTTSTISIVWIQTQE